MCIYEDSYQINKTKKLILKTDSDQTDIWLLTPVLGNLGQEEAAWVT